MNHFGFYFHYFAIFLIPAPPRASDPCFRPQVLLRTMLSSSPAASTNLTLEYSVTAAYGGLTKRTICWVPKEFGDLLYAKGKRPLLPVLKNLNFLKIKKFKFV